MADPLEEIEKLLKSLDFLVTAGVHAEEGAVDHDGLTNAELLEIHEFGLGVPQRSVLRKWADENQDEIAKRIESATDNILGGSDAQTEATRVALWVEGAIKERVLNRLEPELSDATKKRRGEDAVPLVASSQLLGSIRGKAELL